MIFLCYAKCTTCQKAKKWLDANHISYEVRTIKEENPDLKNSEAFIKIDLGLAESEA